MTVTTNTKPTSFGPIRSGVIFKDYLANQNTQALINLGIVEGFITPWRATPGQKY
jgi:hypothetical protein